MLLFEFGKMSSNVLFNIMGGEIFDNNYEVQKNDFVNGMLHKFVNASTFDVYNLYRLTKDGFDWETIEPLLIQLQIWT